MKGVALTATSLLIFVCLAAAFFSFGLQMTSAHHQGPFHWQMIAATLSALLIGEAIGILFKRAKERHPQTVG
ncbi:MAG: hypothetical protein L6Q71_00990 [Planctomycetes bacterium]|nr:hypothetical protein [Planctomycetota bacterium]